MRKFLLPPMAALLAIFSLASCNTGAASSQHSGRRYTSHDPQRAAQIAAEPAGDYWIGRRYVIPFCRMWGYVRRPRESWDTSKLVMFDERQKRQPDRLPEANSPTGHNYAYDHNYEYRLTGYFAGREGYDPNSNLFLPLFTLQSYQLLHKNPGYLFREGESFRSNVLPRPENQP